MIIKYNNKTIKNGQNLTPEEASVKPIVMYRANPKHLYTLIVHDPDAPAGNHLHWIVINIPGLNINYGTHLLSYKGPKPPLKSGIHRYIFKAYKQKKYITDRLIFHRIMPQRDVLSQFNKHIDSPMDTGYFISKFINKKTVGRKSKRVKQTRKITRLG